MDIISYTEEHKIFREAVRKFFGKEVIPFADEWEEAGIVPKAVWRKMGEQGFLCMDVGEVYGGAGADFIYSVILTEELAKTGVTALPLASQRHCGPLHRDLWLRGTEEEISSRVRLRRNRHRHRHDRA